VNMHGVYIGGCFAHACALGSLQVGKALWCMAFALLMYESSMYGVLSLCVLAFCHNLLAGRVGRCRCVNMHVGGCFAHTYTLGYQLVGKALWCIAFALLMYESSMYGVLMFLYK
jgi:hypothetical protein